MFHILIFVLGSSTQVVRRTSLSLSRFHLGWLGMDRPNSDGDCLVLFLLQLGPSVLASFAVFVLGTPVKTYPPKRLFALRLNMIQWTDKTR